MNRLVLAAWLIAASAAIAQESLNVTAPTQPAVGVVSLREQLRWTRYSGGTLAARPSLDDFEAKTMVAFGIAGNLSAELQVPLEYRRTDDPSVDGLSAGIIRLGLKHRVWQYDAGAATDTARLSLLYGLLLPTGPVEMSGLGVKPQIGATAMKVWDRHGITLTGRFTYSYDGPVQHIVPGAGRDSLLELDTAFLYRLAPAAYSETETDAWYLCTELSHNYETNGDYELRLSPGILYEGTKFAAELGVQLPLAHRLHERPERTFGLVCGLRFLF